MSSRTINLPDRPPPMDFTTDDPFTVYRLYDAAGDLLYVGQSSGVWIRLLDHHGKSWWRNVATAQIEGFASREEALAAETAAIETEGPIHNKRRSVGADRPRTYRASDDLYQAAQDRAWERRESVSDALRLALRAYAVDPAALEAACRQIVGEEL